MSFYGEEFSSLKNTSNVNEFIETLSDLYNVLRECWSKETAYPACQKYWSRNDPSCGQCAITAMLVNDMFGGSIHRIELSDGGTHYFNKIQEHYIDLTSEQFSLYRIPISYEPNEQMNRDYCGCNKNTSERFQLLLKNIEAFKARLRFTSSSKGTVVVGHICEECINNKGKFSVFAKHLGVCPFEETERCFDGNPYYIFAKREKNSFILFSKFRVPFDIPKSYSLRIKTLKNTIIQAVKDLQPTDDCLLQAKYGTTNKKTFYDVENVLFYNIGTANFNDLTKKGVVFSSISDIEVDAVRKKYNISDEYSDYYEYTLIPKNNLQNFEDLLVEFKKIPLKCIGLHPTTVWKSLKAHKERFDVLEKIETNEKNTFAIILNIEKPQSERFNVMTAMKPLLDGLICSLHSSEFNETELKYFTDILKCDREVLTSNDISVLGDRKGNFIQVYRKNVKWNPADDLCDYVSINIIEGENWSLSGKIYSTIKCPYCGKTKISKLLYGMPAMTDELQNNINNGKVKLAGCTISENNHHHFCKWCKKTF